MTTIATIAREGWPIFMALGMIGLITWGSIRPYMKKDAARRREMEQDND